MTNLGDGAVAIVGHRLNQQRDAAWTITFVSDLFVVDAFFFTSAATNGAVDRVVRHVAGFRVGNRFAQTRVRIGIAAACPRRDSQFLDELRK